MRIDILCVGKLSERFYRDAADEYVKRLSRYCLLEVVETPDRPAPEGLSERMADRVRREETGALQQRLPSGAVTAALDRQGNAMTSEEFAAFLGIHEMTGKRISFLIGGSLGLSPDFTASADYRISFGSFTYPHQLARVMLLEQIYRGFRIIRGEPYHK
jgi:23S rRNA (pseudouridine1915-N3)-methyltransferase